MACLRNGINDFALGFGITLMESAAETEAGRHRKGKPSGRGTLKPRKAAEAARRRARGPGDARRALHGRGGIAAGAKGKLLRLLRPQITGISFPAAADAWVEGDPLSIHQQGLCGGSPPHLCLADCVLAVSAADIGVCPVGSHMLDEAGQPLRFSRRGSGLRYPGGRR